MRKITRIGECPKCGDDIFYWKAKSGGRWAQCDDEDCGFSYALPKSGKIESMGIKCPKNGYPVITVIKSTQNTAYCWTNGPCFTCSRSSTCQPYSEIIEEYN